MIEAIKNISVETYALLDMLLSIPVAVLIRIYLATEHTGHEELKEEQGTMEQGFWVISFFVYIFLLFNRGFLSDKPVEESQALARAVTQITGAVIIGIRWFFCIKSYQIKKLPNGIIMISGIMASLAGTILILFNFITLAEKLYVSI